MELNDLILLAAASLYPHCFERTPFATSESARRAAVLQAKALWTEVLRQDKEENS